MRSQQRLDSCSPLMTGGDKLRRNDRLNICCRYIHFVQDSPHPHPFDKLRAGLSLSLRERVVIYCLPAYVYAAGAASVTSSAISSTTPCACCNADYGCDADNCP